MRTELGIPASGINTNYELGKIQSEEVCRGDYEVAYHYDCAICGKQSCQFRKGGVSSSERIAVACCMLFCAIIAVVGIIQGINYLGSFL